MRDESIFISTIALDEGFRVAYQLFDERDERLQILFQGEVELVTLLEVDRDYVMLVENV